MQRLLKRLVVGGALSISLAATAWAYLQAKDQEKLAEPVDTKLNQVVDSGRKTEQPIETPDQVLIPRRLDRFANEEAVTDLFVMKNWNEPPPVSPPMQSQIPPPPVAPPLPFQYLGRTAPVEDPGNVLIHLVRGNESYSVHLGENIDQNYKLEKIEENFLQIDYLPLATVQTLSIGRKQ